MSNKLDSPLATTNQNLVLPLPELGESNDVLKIKMRLLVAVIMAKQSIAVATSFVAVPVQERNATKEAVSMMPPDQLEAWVKYDEGRTDLPEIDWTSENPLRGGMRDEELLSHGPTPEELLVDRELLGQVPSTTRSDRKHRQRAEALNHLYKTNKVTPYHSMDFHEIHNDFLPLVKAVARVLAAKRDQLGGQSFLDTEQWADLQTINKVLSLSGRITKANQRRGRSTEIELRTELQLRAEIGNYQGCLGDHRAWLRRQLQEVQKKEEDLCVILGRRNKF